MGDLDQDLVRLSHIALGASECIDILNPSFFREAGHDIHDLAAIADQRLKRRLLLVNGMTGYPIKLDGEWWLVKDIFRSNNWEVNVDCDYTHMGCVLVDNKIALLLEPGQYSHPAGYRTHFIEGQGAVAPYKRYFEALWTGYTHKAALLWDDVLFPGFPDTAQRIAIASNENWSKVIQYLSANPRALYELTPRKFEELIAEILEREGYVTTLTPERKDGGFDVLALRDSPVGKHLYLVECKQYAQSNPVGVSIVRALYGVVERKKASAGLIVTTSRFTKGALEFQADIPHRMSLRKYEDLRELLEFHAGER